MSDRKPDGDTGALPHLRELRREEFVRHRIAPKRSDYYYLHLSDLLLALQAHASRDPLAILDFGAGGSPYRTLFPAADYRTADLRGSDADFDIDSHSRIGAPDGAFDLVLSTQVLEHCRDPDSYLSEALRVLKPGGKLVLSTHGLFEEHGCPDDYFRWTADGLRLLVQRKGFTVDSVARVTAGPRAAFHLMQSALSQSLVDGKSVRWRLLWRPALRVLLARRFWNAVLDHTFPDYRVTSEDLPFANTHVALLIVARRNA